MPDPAARSCAARSPRSSPRSPPTATLDEAAFRRLVRWQVLAGIDGLVPCGTTGESPTLTADERERLIAATVEVAAERPSRDRVRVIAGHRHERHGCDDRAPPAGRPSSAPMPPSSSRRTTTGPTAGCSRRTSGRSPTRATCRSSSTTSRRGRARTSTPTRSCGSPSTRASSRSRRPAATSSRSPGSAATGRATSRSSPATTPGRCRSWRWAAMASCRWPSNEIPGELVAPVRGGAGRRLGRRPAGSTSAGCRSSSPTSAAGRTRSRPRPRWRRWACSRPTPSAAPLLPLDPDGRAAMAATLRDLGLVERGRWPDPRRGRGAGGGRMTPAGRSATGRRARRRADAGDRSRHGPRRPRGRPASGPPSPTRPPRVAGASGPTSRPRSSPASPIGRRRDWTRRPAGLPRPGGGPAARRPGAAGRGGSCRAARPSGAGRISADDVVVMPPSYVNVGAWVGAGTMVDSHVLVGSCAQIGARVHLAAGVTHRRRARAARRPAGHRRGRRVRRGGQRPARRRARRSRARSSVPG